MGVKIKKQLLKDTLSVQEAGKSDNKIISPSDDDVSKYGGLYETASQMISQLSDSHGQKGLQSALSKLLGYSQTVPTIQEFIDDDKWLGNQIGEKLLPDQGLFPCWRTALYEMYPNPFYSPVVECICLSGDTKIDLLDGRSMTMKEVTKEFQNKRFWVLSYDLTTNSYIPAEAYNPRMTRTSAKVYKVTLDNGESFKCTEDHKFLDLNNNWIKAKDLKPGDFLKSYNKRTNKKGYNEVWNHNKKKYVKLYKLVDEWKNGEVQKGFAAHHKIVNIEFAGYEDVYNLTVDHKDHNYILSAGVITKNCTGAIGTGKTTMAIVGAVYDLIKIVLLDNPQKRFRLLNTTKISYAIINATLNLAGDVVYDALYQMVSGSPAIREHLNKSKMRGHTLFNKNVNVFIGSRASHALGEAVIGAILDEINFQQKVIDQAYNNYKSVKRRIESRFMSNTGSYPARVWLLSSKNREVDFLDTHINKVRGQTNDRGEENVKIYDLPIWQAKSHRLQLSGKTFKIFIGDEHRDARIIDRPTDIIGLDESRILDVPIEYEEAFRYDIHDALREIAGVSISSIFKLIPSVEVINKALRLRNPVFREEVQLDLYDQSDVLMDYMDLDNLLTPQYRYCPRYIHIDMGLKHDRLGISSSFVADTIQIKRKDPWTMLETTIMEPLFITEFIVAIKSKTSSEIPLYKIKNFLYELREKGYPISKITLDLKLLSANLRQDLELMGFQAEDLSVDKTKDPYLCLKDAYLQGRILSVKTKILEIELKGLVDTGKKIDHPQDGSKDCSDSQAGSVYSAYRDYLRFPALKSIAEKSRKHIIE